MIILTMQIFYVVYVDHYIFLRAKAHLLSNKQSSYNGVIGSPEKDCGFVLLVNENLYITTTLVEWFLALEWMLTLDP